MQKYSVFFTITIFLILGSLDNAVIGLFPPLFSIIAHDLNVGVGSMGLISGMNILFTAISSIVWGYLADLGGRIKLIMLGTIIWSISLGLTAISQNYFQLLIFQCITGIGLGCISSVGFSVLSDYIPKKRLGTLLSLWGLTQGFGGILGSMIAPILSVNYGWRTPFLILSITGFIFMFAYLFIKEPQKGAQEPELAKIFNKGQKYEYKIEFQQIKELLTKKSNFWLMSQGFFMNITIGTLIWLPTLYVQKIIFEGYSTEVAIIASGYLFAILQLGGITSTFFGYLGDKFHKKNKRARALLTGALLFITIPLYLGMFLLPMKGISLSNTPNAYNILVNLLINIFTNPWMFTIFILSVGATAAQSSNTPNWLALITDVNLPEHRSTSFSMANLVNGIGRSFGNAIFGQVLFVFCLYFKQPNAIIYTMIFFQIFLIPSIYSYYKLSRICKKDITYISNTLKNRASLI